MWLQLDVITSIFILSIIDVHNLVFRKHSSNRSTTLFVQFTKYQWMVNNNSVWLITIVQHNVKRIYLLSSAYHWFINILTLHPSLLRHNILNREVLNSLSNWNRKNKICLTSLIFIIIKTFTRHVNEANLFWHLTDFKVANTLSFI